MSRIFISHIERDAELLQQMQQGLEAAGYSTWFFERDVLPGTSYIIQITEAIEQCDAVVLIVTPDALDSDQVTKEVVGAFERRKPFFPVLVEITPPELKERQPEWRHALGGTAMITVGPEGLGPVINRIIYGLRAQGIQPGGEKAAPVIHGAILTTPKVHTPKPIADKIVATRSRVEGERKPVTVLFADVVGFTSMSEKMDPEEVNDLIAPCIDFMTEEIHHYEGTIAQFTGDGIMALFGAPVAHEDAPQRALHAALGIKNRLEDYSEKLKARGIPFDMRIGLNTGLVIVGRIGDDLTMEYTAMGDTVNLASRMESMAEPGTIQVAESTYRLTEAYFDFQSLGEIEVKGKEEPVKAYRVMGLGTARTRIGASVARGLTPFVGRKREIDHLAECLELVRGGQGQVVGIMGEAGVGKSRLLLEFNKTLLADEYTYLEGGCLHYGSTIAYQPIIEILKSYFDIKDEDWESVIKDRMAKKIDQLDERLRIILPPMHEILSLNVEDEGYLRLEVQDRRRKTFEAIRSLLIRESQDRPVVLVIEDLHWIDSTSEDFLSYLIGVLASTRIMLVLIYRPEYNHQWGNKTYYSQIRVGQLSTDTSTELVQSILEEGVIVPELSELILSRAAGNPLFMEEFTHTLLENGSIQRTNGQYILSRNVSDIHVPNTIQGIIAARMDRLEESLKRIMQVASVIGREFAFRILQAIMGMHEELKSQLLNLQGMEFIYEKSFFPELEYIFKHALTQEVAYNSLLLKKRKEIHQRIGEAIEELYPDRLNEFYEILAYHYKQGEYFDKAIDYLVKSGEKSSDMYAIEESHQYFNEAFDLLANKSDKSWEEKALLIDLILGWATVFVYRGDFKGLTELLSSHKDLAESLDDQARLGMFYARLGEALHYAGKYRDAYQYLSNALKLGEEIEDQRVIGYACANLSWTCEELCLFDEGILYGERAKEVKELFPADVWLYANSLAAQGACYNVHGDTKKALEIGRSLLDYGGRHSNMRASAAGYFITGFSYLFNGDLQSAIESSEKGIQLSQDPFLSYALSMGLGVAYGVNGQFQEAQDTLQQVVTYSEKFGFGSIGTISKTYLGAALIAQGNMAQGQKMIEEAQKVLLENGRMGWYAQSEHILGKIYLQMVERAAPIKLTTMVKNIGFLAKNVPFAARKAENHFNKAIEVYSKVGTKGYLGMAYLDLGLLHKAKGRIDKARECLSEAIQLFQQYEMEMFLKQAQEALASLS